MWMPKNPLKSLTPTVFALCLLILIFSIQIDLMSAKTMNSSSSIEKPQNIFPILNSVQQCGPISQINVIPNRENHSESYSPPCHCSLKPFKGIFSDISHQTSFSRSDTLIYIDGNANFSATASSKGWSGNGTSSAPYIIEGAYAEGLIQIMNTDVHFQITSYELWGRVMLVNVTNSMISNNSIYEDGIIFDSSNGNTITKNYISANARISLMNSSNNKIYNNTALSIDIEASSFNKIYNNSLYGDGIIISHISGNASYNEIYDNRVFNGGIILKGDVFSWSDRLIGNNNIYTNSIFNSSLGISIFASGNNTIFGNSLLNASLHFQVYADIVEPFAFYFDLYYEGFLQANVSDNTVSGKPVIYRQNVEGEKITSEAGQVVLINCSSIEVTGLNLSDASVGLISVHGSNLYIHGNTISNNNEHGILMFQLENSNISDNIIKYNSIRGIYALGVDNSVITLNEISNNGQSGIILVSAYNNTISSNTIDNNMDGIGFAAGHTVLGFYSRTNDNHVFNNTLKGNHEIGIYYHGGGLYFSHGGHRYTSTDNTIESNNVENSEIGMSLSVVFSSIIDNTISQAQIGLRVNDAFSSPYENVITPPLNSLINNKVFHSGKIGLLVNEDYCDIIGNVIVDNAEDGLKLAGSHNNILNNTIANSTKNGIRLDWSSYYSKSCQNNTFRFNTIVNNTQYGIYLNFSTTVSTTENNVTCNAFLDNNLGATQAYDSGKNNLFNFNYWNDWTSPDINADGIVDHPYAIDGGQNKDFYPRTTISQSCPLEFTTSQSSSSSIPASGLTIIVFLISIVVASSLNIIRRRYKRRYI